MTQDLVTSYWLQNHLQDSQVRIIDCRWVLGKPGEGRQLYEQEHIPGAIHLDVDEHLSGKEGPGRHPLPQKRGFQTLIAESGVSRDTHVVAYDTGSGMPAARLWWLLRYFGHEKASVLDGGFNLWTREDRMVTQEIPNYSKSDFTARARLKCVTNKEGVDQLRDDPKVLLLDARAPERYRGEVEPIDAKAGHIPGALNFPFLQTMDASTGRFLSPERLKEQFEKVGAVDAELIICYCGSGITACGNILALKLAGFDSILYEGSWSEWSKDPDLPIAKM